MQAFGRLSGAYLTGLQTEGEGFELPHMFFQAVRGCQELAEQGLWHPANLLYFGALKPGMLHGPF